MCRNSPSTQVLCAVVPCAAAVLLIFATGCERDMADQPRYEAYEPSSFFTDDMASRPLVPGTVARGHLELDEYFLTGKIDGKPGEAFPQPVTAETLSRGRERYNIFCSQCHGELGYGQGMVVRRGFPRPPSYHIDRLRAAPVGHFYDVISSGFGRMPDHAAQIPPADRWAIVAYVRTLQFSQHAEKSELQPADIEQLEQAGQSDAQATNSSEPGTTQSKATATTTPESQTKTP